MPIQPATTQASIPNSSAKREVSSRYGRWSLLLSWVPIIGDPLTLIAGVMREPFWSFFLIVLLAKAARYLVLTVVTLGIMG